MQYQIELGTLEELLEIEQQIPEFDNPKVKDVIVERLHNCASLLLVAKIDGKPVAYKLGYECAVNHFYSWLGAVIPEYRGVGIAQSLLNEQEKWCQEHGYHSISVKSMNRFRSMLMMLLKNNYRIIACSPLSDGTDCKIKFLKHLN
ncbi:GCN5 family acetyltransferase [Pseudoalteromonas luteoviolacea]|uniref:GCN5 family acetyltransferase n=1 Tax=Pseudoalteromonas luteoviolacea TaxID=43657 RepID=A0A1C0TTP8_9GAMM|nr:GNAT family N-acetyltransferase [Pseudoalteromonas luteoviolacea]OCQ22682.1 GCN5 family acetyltransferase [Pseudoalteromonas luteoviolacea]